MANPLSPIHPPLIWCPLPCPSLNTPQSRKAPGKDRGAFGTRSHMNFSFTSASQLSPPLLSLFAITSVLLLSPTSIVCRSGCDSAPGTGRASKQKEQASNHWGAGGRAGGHEHTHISSAAACSACRHSKQLLDCSTWVCLSAYLKKISYVLLFFFSSFPFFSSGSNWPLKRRKGMGMLLFYWLFRQENRRVFLANALQIRWS